ncbi:MAG TPA: ABC-F type ribosomal protection protein, partial [Mobilitalea sp.]|nr:ABC-F type ribosomal protection protein [Mobilitalea sp.]
MILACQNINKMFGTTEILKSVSFHVNEREKAAIVGINGAGKSTLLKIIIGELPADEGEVILSKGATIGYLAQHQNLTSEHTLYEELLTVKKDIILLDQKIRALELDMKHAEGTKLEQMLSTYTRLMHEFEIQNGYAYQSEVTGILKGLGFTPEEFSKQVNTLSGGQKTRIALGKLLLSKPDIILLDEPTNHLDLISISWLETFLLNYNGAVIVVAHDRYFLDKVVSKVIELDNTKALSFEGNYSSYAYKKSMLQNAMLKQYMNQQKEIKHQEEVITKLRSFNREKSIRRAESRVKMLDKIERVDKPMDHDEIHFSLTPRIVSGNDVLTVTEISKSYDHLRLFSNLSFDVKRGEKIAIIGNNGTGKTTILKIVNGMVNADNGEIRLGSKVHVGYYDQEHQVLDPDKTLFEELQDAYPHLDNTAVRNILAAFLFTEDDVFKRIKDISGGERGRVSLAKLMLSEANLLILDEPTNHLDITSKEILEKVINDYSGTVLYVSHDRYFINKTATRILDLTEQSLLNYIGNYDYYLEKKPEMEAAYLGLSGDVPSTSRKPGLFPVTTPSYISIAGSGSFTDSGNPGAVVTSDEQSSDNKLSWQQQKEEQARFRKRQ